MACCYGNMMKSLDGEKMSLCHQRKCHNMRNSMLISYSIGDGGDELTSYINIAMKMKIIRVLCEKQTVKCIKCLLQNTAMAVSLSSFMWVMTNSGSYWPVQNTSSSLLSATGNCSSNAHVPGGEPDRFWHTQNTPAVGTPHKFLWHSHRRPEFGIYLVLRAYYFYDIYRVARTAPQGRWHLLMPGRNVKLHTKVILL